MNYKKCYNFQDFRSLAKSKLPSPIFNYIDGAADDEVTYRRNTSSFDDVSLIPDVLRGVKDVDISIFHHWSSFAGMKEHILASITIFDESTEKCWKQILAPQETINIRLNDI